MLTACQLAPVLSGVRSLSLSPSLYFGRPGRLPNARPVVGRDARIPCARRGLSARRTIEEILHRCCIPLAAARGEDTPPTEFRGYPMKASRSFAADRLDHRHDAGHVRIRLGLRPHDCMAIAETAERARAIRVAELDPADFGCCQGGRGSLGDHLALVLGNGGEDVDG